MAWALYDWANSAFATTVMAGFFPVFFKEYWNAGVAPTTSTFRLGIANSVSSVVIVVLAPVLGSIADAASARRRFLAFFALLGVVATGALYGVPQGGWVAATVLYATATVGFMGGNVFYDSLLVGLSARGGEDRASSLGYGLGYLGGGVLFAINVAMAIRPGWFGIAGADQAVRLSFLSVSLWWALFSVPLFVWVPEPRARAFVDRDRVAEGSGVIRAVRGGLAELRATLGEIRRLRSASLFLVAYWLYIDGVDTVIRMAVDYGLSIGLSSNDLIAALLLIQFVGFPAAVAFGWLGERIGAKRAILIGVAVFVGATLFAATMDTAAEFFGLSAAVALVMGGVQALSRSLFARMVPPGRTSQFFGFYNMLGKFAVIVGPLLIGVTGMITGEPRTAILSVVVLFVAGGALLWKVDVADGERAAREL